ISDSFQIHPNVARAHLDLMVEAGFLATDTRRQAKGRPAKVYFTWESESAALEEAGIDIPDERRATTDDIELEMRILERTLSDAQVQIARLRELVAERCRTETPKP
ncbi:MAG: hypothetical protein ABI571_01760, partial [Actinomycetota bacterium]